MTVWALTALAGGGRAAGALSARRWPTRGGPPRWLLRRATPRSLPLQPKFFLGLALFDCDLVDEARAAYRDALDDEFGSGWWLSDALMADAQASFVIGEWEDAVPGLIAGGQAAQEKGNQLLVSQSLAYRAIIATATGDLGTASELAARIADSLQGDQLSYNAGILAFAVAGLKAAEGDAQGAYDLLLRCWRFDAARENRFYHRWLAPDLVRLALALGHRDVAAEVAEHRRGRSCPGAGGADGAQPGAALPGTGRRRGRADDRGGRARPPGAAPGRACRRVRGRGERCWPEAGRHGEAAALLAEALERYEQAGADAWARRVRVQLRALGVRPGPRGSRHRPAHGWESLTATERAVSRLVAEGLTNGAVARRLYISPHTVNTHLRHVFAKLDVPNRVALAAVVHRSNE